MRNRELRVIWGASHVYQACFLGTYLAQPAQSRPFDNLARPTTGIGQGLPSGNSSPSPAWARLPPAIQRTYDRPGMETDPQALDAELVADDYSYLLPDHWILPRTQKDSTFTVVHEVYVRRVVELIRQSGARTVLEAGCGDGWNCGKLVEVGLAVVGVDWSHNGIEHARRMVRGARFYCGDVRDAGFRREFSDLFDAAIFVEVLEHIPPNDCIQAIRNIASLVKPGGLLVLTTPSVNTPNTNPQHYRHFDEPTLRELIAEAGELSIEAIEGYGNVPLAARHWRIRRWFDNRYWTIKPARKWLVDRYAARCAGTPLDVCEGLILTMRKTR